MAWLTRETRMSYQPIHALTRNRTKSVGLMTIESLCAAPACEPGDLIELDQHKKVLGRKRDAVEPYGLRNLGDVNQML
jgi:DNA-binding Xre family transcriptional regulator